MRLRVNPPDTNDPTVMEDLYLNTNSLQVQFDPPIPLTGDVPALSNLSGQT